MATNKIVLVTGGSRGLGKDMALSLAKKGFDVIVTYNSNPSLANETVNEVKSAGTNAAAIQLDLRALDGIGTFVAALQHTIQNDFPGGALFGIVNNAGMGATVPFTSVTEELFTEFLNVHFKGVYFLTQQLLPLIADGGRIVNISSGTTRFCVPGYSVYASMKGAVEVFTKYLAKELGSRGITANVIAPGPIETDFNAAAIRNNPQMKAALSNMSPLGRVGNADDIGGVVSFLFTEDAKWINGQRIEVSGGINQ